LWNPGSPASVRVSKTGDSDEKGKPLPSFEYLTLTFNF
jgi:hypothetical protein